MTERKLAITHLKAFDRFIPFRPNLDVDAVHARLMSSTSPPPEADSSQFQTPANRSYRRLLADSTESSHTNVLPITRGSTTSPFSKRIQYLSPPTSPDEGYHSPKASPHRRIPTSPDCIMDMPGIRNDFYTHLLDWGEHNKIAVALFESTYIWNAESKECQCISDRIPHSESCHITSLCWEPKNNGLAIADNEGKIAVCDVEKMTLRKDINPQNESCHIGTLHWTEFGIISGDGKGLITINDPRSKSRRTGCKQLQGHSTEVCSLKLAPRTSCLASGDDNGVVNIWDLRMMRKCMSIRAHTAGIKAMAWCPWRQAVLATGGGTLDGNVRLWYAQSGEKLGETCTQLQVCGIVWSDEYKELVAALGSAIPDQNNLILWNMKNCEFEPLAVLKQHTARPLHIALSPDKTTIASAGADESLCLWKTFPRKSGRRSWNKWDFSPLNPMQYVR